MVTSKSTLGEINKKPQKKERKKSFVEEVTEEVTEIITLQSEGGFGVLGMPEPDVIELGEEIDRKKNKAIVEYLMKYKAFSDLKDIASEKLNKLKIEAKNLDIKALKEKIDAYTKTSDYSRQADKVYYLIGCVLTFLTIFILGKYPGTYFFYWLAFIEISMFLKRLHLYLQLNWEYFLIDFCYFCNLLMLVHIFFLPGSKFLSIFLHSVGFGVLSYSLLCFKNSFIFHHIDKLEDLVIHLLPIVTMWNIRYNIQGTKEFEEWGFTDLSDLPFSFDYVFKAFFYVNTCYLGHAIIYYFLICFVWRDNIFKGEKDCLMKYTTAKHKRAMRWHKKYGLWARCALFGVNHYLYCIGMTLLSIPAFFSEYFAIFQLFFYIFIVIKNGADYYFNYFSKKYEMKLKELDELVATEKAASS